MDLSIKCETYLRFAQICKFFDPSIKPEVKEKINTVRIEVKNGKVFAIATNEKIAAVEFLYNTEHQDASIHLIIDDSIIQQCETEKMFDSSLTISVFQEIAVATLKSDLGYTHVGECCHWFDETPLDNWASWFPDTEYKKSKGAMYWDVGQVEALMCSCPSGFITFPEFIDANSPVLIRDVKNPNWAGVFIPSHPSEPSTKAKKPDWID